MRWPWKRRPDDPAVHERERELEARTRAAERQAMAAIAQARTARERSHKHIRDNHLGPTFDLAFKEPR
jgi:RNA polymerase-binding transcription factor DksA